MKKLFFILFGILILFGTIYSGSIRVISPNGGEQLKLGIDTNIIWYAEGVSNSFKITLWRYNELVGVINQNVSNGTDRMTYKWSVGQHNLGTAPFGTGYKIKIKEKGTSVSDISDGLFRIDANSAVLKVLEPRSGFKWEKKKSHTIKWIGIGAMAQNVDISLFKASHSNNSQISEIPIAANVSNRNNGGTFEGRYRILANDFTGFPPGRYRIRIKTTDNKVSHCSETFYITETHRGSGGVVRKIEFEMPRNDKTVKIGETLNMRWKTPEGVDGADEYIDLVLWNSGETAYTMFKRNKKNNIGSNTLSIKLNQCNTNGAGRYRLCMHKKNDPLTLVKGPWLRIQAREGADPNTINDLELGVVDIKELRRIGSSGGGTKRDKWKAVITLGFRNNTFDRCDNPKTPIPSVVCHQTLVTRSGELNYMTSGYRDNHATYNIGPFESKSSGWVYRDIAFYFYPLKPNLDTPEYAFIFHIEPSAEINDPNKLNNGKKTRHFNCPSR